jgi:hypothetical protein
MAATDGCHCWLPLLAATEGRRVEVEYRASSEAP